MDLRLHVSPFLNVHWEDLAFLLLKCEHTYVIANIKQNIQGDIKNRADHMFDNWLDFNHETTWDKLIESLKEINLLALAEQLRNKLSSGVCLYLCI